VVSNAYFCFDVKGLSLRQRNEQLGLAYSRENIARQCCAHDTPRGFSSLSHAIYLVAFYFYYIYLLLLFILDFLNMFIIIIIVTII
jgi:hypothetical protein